MKIIEQRYELALRNYRFKIRHFAKQHERELPGYTVEDIEQEFLEVLWRVVTTYDPNKGAKFNTLFWQCIRNRMADLLKRSMADKRKSEWFVLADEVTELDDDAVSYVFQRMEEGSWNAMERMNPEDWFLLQETIIERLADRRQTA